MAAAAGRYDRTLVFAIAISAVVHLFVLLGPAWEIPNDKASVLPPLDARLTPLPRPTLKNSDDKRVVLGDAPPPRPRPRPRKPVKAAEPQPSAAPVAQLAPDAVAAGNEGDGRDAADRRDAPPEVEAEASGIGKGGAGGMP